MRLIAPDCLLHQVRELPYWWAPDVRPLWDERAGNDGAIMPRGSKGKEEDGASANSRGGVNGPNAWRSIFEFLVTCGKGMC